VAAADMIVTDPVGNERGTSALQEGRYRCMQRLIHIRRKVVSTSEGKAYPHQKERHVHIKTRGRPVSEGEADKYRGRGISISEKRNIHIRRKGTCTPGGETCPHQRGGRSEGGADLRQKERNIHIIRREQAYLHQNVRHIHVGRNSTDNAMTTAKELAH
jgi:hypothetical protein